MAPIRSEKRAPHGLTSCDTCHIYHCPTCGCPRDNHKYPNYPNTGDKPAEFVRHLTGELQQARTDRLVMQALHDLGEPG